MAAIPILSIKYLTKNPGIKKYFFNTSYLFLDKILNMIFALFVGIYVARYLGPQKFGLLSYATSFVSLFSVLATLGLNNIIVRNLIRDEEQRDNMLGTAFGLRIIGSLILCCIVMSVIQVTSADKYTKILVAVIAAGTFIESLQVINFYFQAKVQARFSTVSSILAMIIGSVVKLILIFYQAELIWFAYAIVTQRMVLCIGYIIFYKKNKLSLFKWRFKLDMSRSLLKDSWPLILSGLVITLYMRIDQIMIKEMIGGQALGQYAVAVKLSEVWYFIPIAINTSLFPAVLNAQKVSETLYYDRLQQLFDLMVLISVGVALPISFLSTWIIKSLYGIEYIGAADVLAVYVWAGVFVFLNNATWHWHISQNNQKIAFIRLGFGCIVNIALNLVLIPGYGIIGASFATLLSYSVATYWGHLLFKETRPIFLRHSKSLFFINVFKGKSFTWR